MKIGFADFIDWDYKVESAYQIPMGGSQSSLCYLAEALAQQGHDVFLLNNTSAPGMSCGVMCLSWASTSVQRQIAGAGCLGCSSRCRIRSGTEV